MNDDEKLRRHAHPDGGSLLGTADDQQAAADETAAGVHTGSANGIRPVTAAESGLGDDPDAGVESGIATERP